MVKRCRRADNGLGEDGKTDAKMDPFENGPKKMPKCVLGQTPTTLFSSGNGLQKDLRGPNKRGSSYYDPTTKNGYLFFI